MLSPPLRDPYGRDEKGIYSPERMFRAILGWELPTATLAPDRNEVAFEGSLRMSDAKLYKLRLLVGHDKSSGKWRVDAVSIAP